MEYVLYGIGLEAEAFLFQHPDIQIDLCIDKHRKETSFHNIPVYRPDIIKKLSKKFFIVAAKSWTIYSDIKRELLVAGLKEFDDFVWCKQFQKKLVLINANCHGNALQTYLNCIKQFSQMYAVYPIPQVQNNDRIDIELLQRADVFIHQDIRTNNISGYYVSDEFTLSHVRKNCLNIVIPNFVGMGKWMYPTTGKNNKSITRFDGVVDQVVFRDLVLDTAYEKGLRSIKELIDFWESYEVEGLSELQDKDFSKIRLRQKNWTIQIADFVCDNYQRIPCFVDHGHPSKYIMMEIGKKVAETIGIEGDLDRNYCLQLGLPLPVLPCVEKHYNFNFEVEREIREEYFGKKVVDELEDYIYAYMWWYHDIRIK
jgi:hypothetical protein